MLLVHLRIDVYVFSYVLDISGVLVFVHLGWGPGLQEEKIPLSYVVFGKAGNRRNY